VLIFSFGAFWRRAAEILGRTPPAVFGMAKEHGDVLVRGEYEGSRRGVRHSLRGRAADWAYNSMPPFPSSSTRAGCWRRQRGFKWQVKFRHEVTKDRGVKCSMIF
jgi:hypothetical protein